jgi:hypothetical protein
VSARIVALEPLAPDVVLAWRGIDDAASPLDRLEQVEATSR